MILAEDGPLVGRLRALGVPVRVERMERGAAALRRDDVKAGPELTRVLLPTARYTWRLARMLRRERPDIVHTNSLKAALYGGIAGRLAGVPVVWHIRDRIAEDYLPAQAVGLVRRLSRILPAAVIANSASTVSTLGGGPEGRRFVIYNALPQAVINDPLPPPTQRSRRRRGADAACTIGIVGRLAPWKGQDVFIRAVGHAARRADVHGVIIGAALFGEDDYAAELEKLVDDLGLGPIVTFSGWREDVFAELNGLDILVHASVIPEPFGQVVAEGMAAGLAVVAGDQGGPAELITSGVDGVLVPPNDPTALGDALADLAHDAERRAQLGRAARKTVERLRPAVIARRVRDVYEQVAGR